MAKKLNFSNASNFWLEQWKIIRFAFLNSVCDKESNDMWIVLIRLYLHWNRLSDLSLIEFENGSATATKSMLTFERLSPRQIAWKVWATCQRQSLESEHTFLKYAQVWATATKRHVAATRRLSDRSMLRALIFLRRARWPQLTRASDVKTGVRFGFPTPESGNKKCRHLTTQLRNTCTYLKSVIFKHR